MKSKILYSMVAIVMMSSILLFLFSTRTEGNEGDSTMLNNQSIVYVEDVDIEKLIGEKGLRTIYFAGGCFWGVEEYMSRIAGIYDVTSGYANGKTSNPTYEEVIYDDTGHAETVRVVYDPKQISLDELLVAFFKIIDPTSLNKQGNDVGTQYRTGIYFEDSKDKTIIDTFITNLQQGFDEKIVVEALPLSNFYIAEEYHQDYLIKNPNGYCHINLESATSLGIIDPKDYPSPSVDKIKDSVSIEVFNIIKNNDTEPSFSSDLNDNYEVGLYVDIITGEPLFLSTDKFNSGTGWPSFTKPISDEVLIADIENGNTYEGFEVKSRSGLNHLGHYFTDGPSSEGGLRYCINGSSLRFVHYNLMVEEGYGYLQHLINNDSSIKLIQK